MKTEIYTIATVICILIFLGTQALLGGSWKVRQTEPVKGDHEIK